MLYQPGKIWGTFLFYLFIDSVSILSIHTAFKIKINSKTPTPYYEQHKHSYKQFYIQEYIIFYVFSFLTLFLVSALRDNVGSDYSVYANAYMRVNHNVMRSYDYEWLGSGTFYSFKFIGLLFGKDNYFCMIAIVSFVTLLFYYKSIYFMSNNWALSLYILIAFCIYYQTFNQLRQGMAIAITTYSLRFLQKNQINKYVALVFLASIFHTSALVMMGLAFFGRWEISIKRLLIYLIICIVLYLNFNIILGLLRYTHYGNIYLSWSKYNTSYERSSILFLLVRFGLMIGCLLFSKRTIKRYKNSIVFYNSIIFCTILQMLTLKSYLFGRTTLYYYTSYIFLLPQVLECVTEKFKKNNKTFIKLMFCASLVLYYIVYYFGDSGAFASGYAVYKSLLF